MDMYQCYKCKKQLEACETYEYRGLFSCEEHFDEGIETRDFQRQEIIEEERHKTQVFEGLSLGDNPIGRANRQILKPQIEIAAKESGRLKEYEGR